MRLGAYECHIIKNSLAEKVYGESVIFERHRHRYEVNIKYKQDLEKIGLRFSGMSPDGILPDSSSRKYRGRDPSHEILRMRISYL